MCLVLCKKCGGYVLDFDSVCGHCHTPWPGIPNSDLATVEAQKVTGDKREAPEEEEGKDRR